MQVVVYGLIALFVVSLSAAILHYSVSLPLPQLQKRVHDLRLEHSNAVLMMKKRFWILPMFLNFNHCVCSLWLCLSWFACVGSRNLVFAVLEYQSALSSSFSSLTSSDLPSSFQSLSTQLSTPSSSFRRRKEQADGYTNPQRTQRKNAM